jgi:hypothetical protein
MIRNILVASHKEALGLGFRLPIPIWRMTAGFLAGHLLLHSPQFLSAPVAGNGKAAAMNRHPDQNRFMAACKSGQPGAGSFDHASCWFLGIMLNWLPELAGKKSRMDRVESSKERGKWIITCAQDPFDLETVDLENILNAPY